MIGHLLYILLLGIMGYLYPAYRCFKAIEKPKPDPHEVRFWMAYWVIVGFLTAVSFVADPVLSWVPFYNELKLAFVVYLWHPRTLGAVHVYNTYIRPKLTLHEPVIDHHLAEWQTRGGQLVMHYWGIAYNFIATTVAQAIQHHAQSQVQGPQPAQNRRLQREE